METAVLDTPAGEPRSLASRFESKMAEQTAHFADELERGFAELVKWEDQHLDADPTAETLRDHRQAVEAMRLFSRLLEVALSHPDFPDRILAQRVRTVAEALDDHLAMWHRPLSAVRRADILKGCFNES
jgi:hypothetical protein